MTCHRTRSLPPPEPISAYLQAAQGTRCAHLCPGEQAYFPRATKTSSGPSTRGRIKPSPIDPLLATPQPVTNKQIKAFSPATGAADPRPSLERDLQPYQVSPKGQAQKLGTKSPWGTTRKRLPTSTCHSSGSNPTCRAASVRPERLCVFPSFADTKERGSRGNATRDIGRCY